MADIDLLKVWERGKNLGHADTISVDLERATRGQSKSTLQWISIILWIELGLNVVLTPFIYVWFKSSGLSWHFWVFLGIVGIYLAYYIFLLRAIRRFDFAVSVRSGLKKVYRYLNFYLLHYKVVIWVLFPVSYTYGVISGLAEDGNPELSPRRWMTLIGVSVLFNGLFCLLFNWLINMIYGRKIKRLRGMVMELEAVE
ncbi:MAG: hypothetical protein AAGA85_17985 [Bacteroidota bacterium]